MNGEQAKRDRVIERIRTAFVTAEFPGPFLRGSNEGCEPAEECDPFQAYPDWRAAPAGFLDQHGAALSFFSEAGFRFYLPAYLVADLEGKLQYAEPLFHLTHGFHDFTMHETLDGRAIEMHHGRAAFLNPRRYGAMTNEDYARYRLAIFTREESGAILAYLEYKRDADRDEPLVTEPIAAAIRLFWGERATTAPPAADLAAHLEAQAEYLEAVRQKYGK